MHSPTSAASNLPVVSATDLAKSIHQYKNEYLSTLLQYPETAVLARNFQMQQPQTQTLHVAVVAPEHDEALNLCDVLNSANVLGAAQPTPAISSTKTQADQLAHAMIYAVSAVTEQIALEVDKHRLERNLPLHQVVIVLLQNTEAEKDGESLLRKHVPTDTTILPLSLPLSNAIQSFTDEHWTALCKIGREMTPKVLNEQLEYLHDPEPLKPLDPNLSIFHDVRMATGPVIRATAQYAEQERIKNGEALKKRVLRASGIEKLKDRFAYLHYPDMPKLAELLSVAKPLTRLHHEAVSILQDVVQAETEEQEHAHELRDALEKLTAGQTAEPSRSKSLDALQAAIDHIDEAPQQDSQEQGDIVDGEVSEPTLLGDIAQKLSSARTAISKFTVPDAVKALDQLEAVIAQAKERVETRKKQAEESRSAAMPIIAGLETVRAYLESDEPPPSRSDVDDAAQPLLKHLTTNNEKRLKIAQDVLDDVHKSHAQFESDVAMFEEDIRCLIHLASPDTEVEEPDKTTLARLFGRHGTDVTTRVEVEVPPEDPEFNKQALQLARLLGRHGTDVTTRVEVEVPPEDPEFNKQALQKVEELDTRWEYLYLIHTSDNEMISHAKERLAHICEALERSGESQHDN